MSDDFSDYVPPISGGSRIDGLGGQSSGPPSSKAGQSIAGRIVAVHGARPHRDGPHRLDVSVGGETYAEIVVRVPAGSYAHLEGKRAVLHVD